MDAVDTGRSRAQTQMREATQMAFVSGPDGAGFPDWQHDFKVAINSGQLDAARTAISLRLRAKARRPPNVLERIALNDAILLLRTLRSEHARYVDAEGA